MKLAESAAFKFFDKHGIVHPKVNPTSGKVVVKADLAVGGKKKAGLVEICDFSEAVKVSKKIGGPTAVYEYIPHREEYFVALKAVREGVEVYYSGLGGVDVERNWDKVAKIIVPPDARLTEDYFFTLIPEKSVREWVVKLYQFFQDEDATYLEINPFTVINKQVMPLGVVLVLDDAAGFRHDWEGRGTRDEGLGTEREKRVAEVDSQIKGSVKLVEVPGGGTTALMAGGGGAALFLCDAILDHGLKLADYAEFSGNPPEYAVYELAKEVLKIPGIKNLVIGSGIANFTPVVGNFRGIIQGFKESPQAKKLNIVIRRCGPEEDAAILMMKEFAKTSGLRIQVFGRETGMTEIVKKLK